MPGPTHRSRLSACQLTLLFTRGVSLQDWEEVGMLGRELALYRALGAELEAVHFVTYGGRRDLRASESLGDISVSYNRHGLPESLYVRALPWLHRGRLSRTKIFKSNQVRGAEVALALARHFGRPFVARCGYLHSDFMLWRHGPDSAALRDARALEARVFRAADRVVVTTERIRRSVIERNGLDPHKVRIIPNYVETARFRPAEVAGERDRLIYVGRLEHEKNVTALVEAMTDSRWRLTIIGSGPLREPLEALVRRRGLPVEFAGNVRNTELPARLARASAFVLPSHLEGHPKALLEAMACGLPTIGADVPGIREIVHDGENGVLSGTSAGALRAAIDRLMGDEGLRRKLGGAGRDYVVEHFALERVLEAELELLEEVMEA